MNNLKQQIDNDLKNYDLRRDVNELFVKYKREKRKKISVAVSAVCVVLVMTLLGGGLLGIYGDKSRGLSLTASALDIKGSSTPVIGGQKLMLCLNGVQKISKKVGYDSTGREVFGKKSRKKSGSRLVLVPSPISLSIVGENIRSYVVTCTSNGTVYNANIENLGRRTIGYKGNESINWIPNCDKLSRSLKADMTMYPSNVKNDELLTKEINSALRTADDYTHYFGDTLTITARYKNGSTETLKAVITLDEKGSYYISTQKE